MKAAHLFLFLHVFWTAGVLVNAIDPFTTGAALGVGVMVWNAVYEGCNPIWINFNETGLKFDLKNKLFGQHIAADVILNTVAGFKSNNDPQKPLALSLHGGTGTGKNHAARLIAENIYSKGMGSKFVHVFTADHHFRHKSDTETHKVWLKQQIKQSVTKCKHSMFIFDEMDKMDPGLVETIKPYLEHYNNLDGVSYRNAIFIFLSNAGGESITQTTLDFLLAGRNRDEIKLRDLEGALSKSAFNEAGGLKDSRLIIKHLVDYFIPFLPLENRHVIQCILAEMKARGLTQDYNVALKLAKDLVYVPKTEKVFSLQGCKTIESKLYFYI